MMVGYLRVPIPIKILWRLFTMSEVKQTHCEQQSLKMVVFSKMMSASKQATLKSSREKTSRVPCLNYDATFPNAGAMAQHTKYKHKNKVDAKKHPKLSFAASNSSSSSAANRRPATPPKPKRKKERKSPRKSPVKKAKTRRRYTNSSDV